MKLAEHVVLLRGNTPLWLKKLKEGGLLGDQSIAGRIILKWIMSY
jgi:hypothetical protein